MIYDYKGHEISIDWCGDVKKWFVTLDGRSVDGVWRSDAAAMAYAKLLVEDRIDAAFRCQIELRG